MQNWIKPVAHSNMVSPLHHTYNLEPTAIHTPVQCQSKWKAVRTCSSTYALLSEFLTAYKNPLFSINHYMNAVYADNHADVSTGKCGVWQFKQKVGEAVVSGDIQDFF
jgi:hypothetical protein